WRPQEGTLRLSKNAPFAAETIAIIAPHPDDAEIAAFSFFRESKPHIVTICAGRKTTWNLSQIDQRVESHPRLAAQMRVWDSLTVPLMAGVPADHLVQLAYPDDSLARMRAEPETTFVADYDFETLRSLNNQQLPFKDSQG